MVALAAMAIGFVPPGMDLARQLHEDDYSPGPKRRRERRPSRHPGRGLGCQFNDHRNKLRRRRT